MGDSLAFGSVGNEGDSWIGNGRVEGFSGEGLTRKQLDPFYVITS